MAASRRPGEVGLTPCWRPIPAWAVVWDKTQAARAHPEAQPNLEAIWPRLARHMSPPDLSWGEGGSQALGTSTNCTVAAPSPRVDLAWLALPWNKASWSYYPHGS